MPTNKTVPTKNDVTAFIKNQAEEKHHADSFRLIELMKAVTGEEPKLWGASIVGFGSYHYKYDSGHEGDAPLIGFSPRKAAISLYVYTGNEAEKPLVESLGKFKIGKACIYIKRLADISEEKLNALMKATIKSVKTKYKVA